VYITVS